MAGMFYDHKSPIKSENLCLVSTKSAKTLRRVTGAKETGRETEEVLERWGWALEEREKMRRSIGPRKKWRGWYVL